MILTLCGSARFEEGYHHWNRVLTLAGHTVFSLGAFPSIQGQKNWYDAEQKTILDLVHLAKIQVSNAIVVINGEEGVNNHHEFWHYIGESTRREIAWARIRSKEAYYVFADRVPRPDGVFVADVNQLLRRSLAI